MRHVKQKSIVSDQATSNVAPLSPTLPKKLAAASSSSSVLAEDPQMKNVIFCLSLSVAPLQQHVRLLVVTVGNRN